MNDETFSDHAETLFHQAIELPESERDAFLDRACGGDTALRQRIANWLRLERKADGYLRKPTIDPHDCGTSVDPLIGTRLGPFKILQVIGEGGCGVVYMAEQREPVTRKVALKILKLGMDTKQVIARFEAERQALALMEHPNIAKVFEAGSTEGGRPYFVMELVSGSPITTYCDQRGFNTEQRLALFMKVCLAVQHAHHKGIIHRDLKPGNILVATNGDEAVPMIIDFGIAKATQGRLTEKTLFTQFQQFVGTPEYMSPEQAQMSTVQVDTRSDVYSLGVLLYELLTGKSPLDARELRAAGYEEICRRIREDTAPKPSRRLTTMPMEELTTLAKQRSLTSSQFTSSIRGDLDWIVMKAVEKDVARRYESCSALAADLERYARDEPVLAGPPSALYQLKKFARRHRAAAAAAVGIVVSLVLGTAIAVSGMMRAIEQRKVALRTAYLADMQAAHQALKHNNFALASRILDQNRDFSPGQDPRHWEWRALWQQCRETTALTLAGPGEQGNPRFAIAPDGRTVVVTVNNQIRVWDLTTGKLRATLEHEPGFSTIAFSPKGEAFYVGNEKIVQAWDFPSLTKRQGMFSHDRRIIELEISPDGNWLAALGNNWNEKTMNLALWDLQTGQRQHLVEVSKEGGALGGRLEISWDGKHIGVGAPLRILDSTTLEDVVAIQEWGGRGALAFSPDGQFVASSGGLTDTDFKIHRLSDGQFVDRLIGHEHGVLDLAYSPDSRYLASASVDQTVVIWAAATHQMIKTLRGHHAAVKRVRFTPDSRRLVSSGDDGRVCVWDIPDKFQSNWPVQKEAAVIWRGIPHSQVSYSADGKLLAATSDWDSPWAENPTLRSPQSLKVLRKLTDGGRGVRFSPVDSNLIAVGFQHDGSLGLFDVASGRELKRVTLIPEAGPAGKWGLDAFAVFPVDFSRNGERLLVMARMEPNVSKCVIFRVPDLTEFASWILRSDEVEEDPAAALSPDGDEVVASGYRGTRFLTPGQPADQAEVLFKDHLRMAALDYSPDGRLVALGGSGRVIRLIDTRTRETVGVLTGHSGTVWSARFSPDGQRLASGAEARMEAVKLWDVETRREILTLEVDGYWNRQIEWSPDGNSILMMGGGADLNLWRVPSFEEIAEAEAALPSKP